MLGVITCQRGRHSTTTGRSRADLIKATKSILPPDEVHELVVDDRTMTGPEAGTRGHGRMEKEQILAQAIDVAITSLDSPTCFLPISLWSLFMASSTFFLYSFNIFSVGNDMA